MQEWYRSMSLYEAVLKLISAGNYEEAMDMARAIPDKVVLSKAMSRITLELARRGGDYGEALELAVKSALDIENESGSTKALMSLAFEFLNMGDTEEALKIAEYMKDLSNKSKIQAEVAMVLAKSGKVSEAMELIDGIMDEDVKTWAMSRLASQL
ncbi:tetratricopeptide repeat protein [Thermococcus sp.]|uniref:tetratricopeptide repeat protein n=1 Tax=Thermococcus sp. TaxID=35749 RepID=UPI0025F9EA78|nr:tetratricopeptide repeat protein [Thermococcus sp.]